VAEVTQVAQVESQAKHELLLKYLPAGQVRQALEVPPEQVAQVESQTAQKLFPFTVLV
jgi:hypothetical protein